MIPSDSYELQNLIRQRDLEKLDGLKTPELDKKIQEIMDRNILKFLETNRVEFNAKEEK